MRIAPVTDETTLAPARETLRPLLSLGKKDKALHELRVLLDSTADTTTHNALKTVRALLQGNGDEAQRLMTTMRTLLDDDDLKHAYSCLLVDAAVCLALEGDVALATLSLREADHGLATHGEEGVAAQGVQTLLQLAEEKAAMARGNYYQTKATWITSESHVILGWIQVVGLAVYRATEDPSILEGLLHINRPLPFVQDELRRLERKFRRRAWIYRAINQPVPKKY